MYEHVDINRYCKICNPVDQTHTNTIQSLPENRHYDARDERFKPENILLSPRNLSYIFIVDKDTKEIVQEYTVKWHRILGRAYRYPYDHCSQLKELGKPVEKKVKPPSYVRTRPFDWQAYLSPRE